MKSNKTLSIPEIQDKYENRRRYSKIGLIFGFLNILVVLFLFIANVFPEFVEYRIVLLVLLSSLFLIFILIVNKVPYMSRYEEIRYHLSKLIENLSKTNYKKSEYYLDKLAFNLSLFLEEIEDIFIHYDVRDFLHTFLFTLKYDYYPDISNKARTSGILSNLEQIEKAISDEDLEFLYSITSGLKSGKLIKGEQLIKNEIILPYEMPSLFNRIIAVHVKALITHPMVKFVIIYLFVASLLLSGYYFSIKMSLLTFDYTLFSTLLLISVAIAEKIK